MQYIELFKKPEDDGAGGQEESFTYASDFLGNPYDYEGSEYQFFTYDDDTEIYASDYWNDDPVCTEVLGDLSYYYGLLSDGTTYSTSSTPSFTGGFHKDTVGGHGTWTAGSAAGSISPSCATVEATCLDDELPGCAGGCIPASDVDFMLNNPFFDLELYCPMYGCDGTTDSALSDCLSDDPAETLRENGGVAPGAQLSFFDASYTGADIYVRLAGNHVWDAAVNSGAKIHSSSWGSQTGCQLTDDEFMYDTFMHEVR